MNTTNVSYTRNHLSAVLSRVKEGETIVIMDRQRPVARLEPVAGLSANDPAWLAEMVRRGLVQPARGRLNPKALGDLPLPMPQGGGDILEALLAEREESR